MEICDGDLVRLARDGDRVAFRLLVERHQPMARARAARLCLNPSDVDDIVQESFLQALLALDRLREPDRFGGWLGGIVHNMCRGLQRRAPLTLLPDWPEPVHPVTAGGLPSADDLDRADAVRAAVADLPAAQRRAVVLHYYADQPAGQAGESAGAARASLHKARLRLRAYITEHRPDLVPAASRRTHMTTVHIARAEHLIPPDQPIPNRLFSHVIVLADDAGRRELPVWLLGSDGHHLAGLLDRPADRTPRNGEELLPGLLRAAGASVTSVDIDELGPEVTAARIGLTGPTGTRNVTARLVEGLAVAITTGAPIRVADPVLDRLAAPTAASASAASAASAASVGSVGSAASAASAGRPGSAEVPAWPAGAHGRPRYEPRNLTFGAGLDGWMFDGSFAKHASESHWHDYSFALHDGVAVIRSAVARPEGFAMLRQAIFADDYRGGTVTFRGEFRIVPGHGPGAGSADGSPAGRAGLFLRVNLGPDIRGPLSYGAAMTSTDHNAVALAGDLDWTSHELTVQVPEDSDTVVFGVFLAGRGRIELRHLELIRGS
jgi:RNA polymerase sigma-70 factor (ECF subfamily)